MPTSGRSRLCAASTGRDRLRRQCGGPVIFAPRPLSRQELRTMIHSNVSVSTPEVPILDVVLKRFEAPDETRTFEKGRFEIIRVGGMTIGRATYEPGWRWSVHVGAKLGQAMCEVEHVGMVVSGCATAAMSDGRVIEMRGGDALYVGQEQDMWV